MSQPERLDLTGFVALPHDPAYLVRKDGRVASLKKQAPVLLSEQKASSPVWYRVRRGSRDYRVRDLVAIMFGDTSEFEARAREEIPPREPRTDDPYDFGMTGAW